jgi:predicted secreted protein
MRTSIAVATFFCLWFITLFVVLPFFAKTQGEAGEIVPGTPESAPHNIKLWKVFLVNTVVAIITFAIVYAVIANLNSILPIFGLIPSFRGVRGSFAA